MYTFKEYAGLTEGFNNLFVRDKAKRESIVDDVWKILEDSYKSIGGLIGNGFQNKETMISKIPFWKVASVDGKIVAVVMYKDKGGRKSVASATDGSADGKRRLLEILRGDFKRSWGERSSNLLRFIERKMPELIKQYAIPATQVKELIGDKRWDESYEFIPNEKFKFIHVINNTRIEKMAMGTPGKKVVPPITDF